MQREFVEKLLGRAVFQRHMTAVREVLNMLRTAQKIRDDGEVWDDAAIKVLALAVCMMQATCVFYATGSLCCGH